MTRASIKLVTAERRRRWTRAEERLVDASFEPGVLASEVAREAGLHVSQLFRWRRLLCKRVTPPAPVPVPALVPIAVEPAYHPSTLLKLYLYGYLNRVPSSRRLEREAQRKIEVMWLTGRLAPDYKTIAKCCAGS